MLYDFSKMNVEQTKQYLADTYDKHHRSSYMLMRVRITRRVLSILALHSDWDENDVFLKVQDSFRKGKGSEFVRAIDRELYDYFKANWFDIIKLENIKEGEEFEHYAKWSNVKLSKEEYVDKARAKWGDVYDYSESVYKSELSPITIRCIKHNYYFTVQAGNHIQVSQSRKSGGCPICAQERLNEYRKTKHEEFLKRKQQILDKKNSILAQVEKLRKQYDRENPQAVFIRKAKALYPNYDYSRVEYTDREHAVIIGCPQHGYFHIRPRTLLSREKGKKTHGCWKCNNMKEPVYGERIPLEIFKDKMTDLYGDKYVFHWDDYKVERSMIRFECKQHGLQSRTASALKDGKGCLYCSGKFYPKDWLKMVRAVHGDKYVYDESKPPKSKTSFIRYKCPEHGWQTSRLDSHLNAKHGCPLCGGHTNELTLEQRKQIWVKRCRKKFNDRFDYSRFVYVNNDTNGLIICREHHYSYMIGPWTHLRGSGGCPCCTGSKGEVHIRTWLENHHVPFIPQYKIQNENLFCKRNNLYLDFFCPEQNLVIEMNGEQHYRYISYFHDINGWSFEDQQIRDETVRTYCKEHHIHLLVIKFNQIEDIPAILSKYIKFHKQAG